MKLPNLSRKEKIVFWKYTYKIAQKHNKLEINISDKINALTGYSQRKRRRKR